MKRVLIVAIVMVSALLVGCGHSFYPTDNHNFATTNVNLSEGNFRIIGIAEGKATATYVFGIGGLSKKALNGNAYSDMIKNAKLKGSQMIVNTTIETKVRGFTPLFFTKDVRYHGLVIEFDNSNIESGYTPDYSGVSMYKAKMLTEDMIDEIKAMSSLKRQSHLVNITSRLNSLCSQVDSNPKRMDKYLEEIETKMARLKYILDNYDCRKTYHVQYEKFSAILGKLM